MLGKRGYPPAAVSSHLAWLGTTLLVLSGSAMQAQTPKPEFINPPGLTRPTGYTHVVVSADGRTAYIAGQVAFDSTGKVVGVGDFQAQAEQVFANLRRALASVGASFGDVVKTTTFLTDLKNLPALRDTRARYFDPTHPACEHSCSGHNTSAPGLVAGDRGGGGSAQGATALAVRSAA
jgi:2-iminobutanoate/2-iminopropanoate deaminase